MALGAEALLVVIFVVPAVLVPSVMDDVPVRSMNRVVTMQQRALEIVDGTFAKHRRSDHPGRLSPLPVNSRGWIELINPMGRKAPGGGLAILPDADDRTGAIGVMGDIHRVVVTMPAYRDLAGSQTVVLASTERMRADQ